MDLSENLLDEAISERVSNGSEADVDDLPSVLPQTAWPSADENDPEKYRPSGLRPPSKLPASMAKPLHVSYDNEGNRRLYTTSAMSSQLPSLKRKQSNLTTSSAKRNTKATTDSERDSKEPDISSFKGPAQTTKRIQGSNSRQKPLAHTAASLQSISAVQPNKRNLNESQSAPLSMSQQRCSLQHFGKTDKSEFSFGGRELVPLSENKNFWDTKGRLQKVEMLYGTLWDQMNFAKQTANETSSLLDQINLYKMKVGELESSKIHLTSTTAKQQAELDEVQSQSRVAKTMFENRTRELDNEIDALKRMHRVQLDDMRDEHAREKRQLRQEQEDDADVQRRKLQKELKDLTFLKEELEATKLKNAEDLRQIDHDFNSFRKDAQSISQMKDRDIDNLRLDLENSRALVDREQQKSADLLEKLTHSKLQISELESSMEVVKAKATFLESDSQAQSQAFAESHKRLQEAIQLANDATDKLRREETLRRKLHNQVQELKGNIRVYCRIRATPENVADQLARIEYPDAEEDSRELLITGPDQKSALGKNTTQKYSFAFDKVFGPAAHNAHIFEELSQMVQSALDGFNVCIFCYGQTGSGKTFTMSSPGNGMIPLAVQQIYETIDRLAEKGWKYTTMASFVEVYNETITDLLGDSVDTDRKKHDILHEKGRTTVTEVNYVHLKSPGEVDTLLQKANSNRSVAATKANERSSRSHSVLTMTLRGENPATGETLEGTLNLVDLAGSERLAHSQAKGERLRETQNINKSLSCLGDVIAALGSGKEHIPYRNSKLTYLLQNSLGGNSKTLMLVMISPMMEHFGETISSLKFATKVVNTYIGTAKKQAKV